MSLQIIELLSSEVIAKNLYSKQNDKINKSYNCPGPNKGFEFVKTQRTYHSAIFLWQRKTLFSMSMGW